ncbi:MAG: bifunctional oligoribonuclease/PAP phosphatase NrnA [Bacteroidetes bacterium]|uniref:DHH family phosphoesterase n=1 Tax=Phnomibacter sp. TaxID=2836217 RepID=UPI002FDE982A|nr:bifunctional oligoribonuclease/PAP phosphatase NrnA [Bacteroidota bacterium]
MNPITAFYPLLQEKTAKVVITCHQKPDGDAMGSTLALYHYLVQLGHEATVISPTNWAAFLNWMPGVDTVVDFEAKTKQAEALIAEADWLFCLDFNTLSRTKRMETALGAAKGDRILIDHHQEPQEHMFAYGISDTGKSSTCEMVYDFIVESGGSQLINQAIAQCLYTGVMTDTGSFRFPSTTASVHRMIAHLKETGFAHSHVHDHIYDSFLENRLRFIGHVLLNRMEVIYEMNTAVMAISKADLYRFDITTGDTEGLVNYPLSIQGIKMAAIVIDRDEERKWSFRSKGDVDVNQFARQFFEGGGHKNAAGGRSSDSLENTLKHFYEVLGALQPQLIG